MPQHAAPTSLSDPEKNRDLALRYRLSLCEDEILRIQDFLSMLRLAIFHAEDLPECAPLLTLLDQIEYNTARLYGEIADLKDAATERLSAQVQAAGTPAVSILGQVGLWTMEEGERGALIQGLRTIQGELSMLQQAIQQEA